ncbi:MAG TPA: uracil-DNA glycosylase [Verrucomicrobiota bacterium]|nr:uracil-DNA glycosylase [Verrucomicrobiota bacterium]HNT13440.1 uracil-DNA glycosylase [Verrucomicrobiota bacterium]
MQLAYVQLLDHTIRHLEAMQRRGQRRVIVSAETLRALSAPARHISRPAPAPRPPAAPRTVPSSRTILMPQPPLPKAAPGVATSPIPRPVQAAPARVAHADKAAAYAELRREVLACVKCPHLVAARKSVVFGVGDIEAQLMFVGEAPGADEDLAGEPFVGKAGQLLTRIIETMGLTRSTVYIANVLKCRPDTPGRTAGNRPPTEAEMATCLPYLERQIDLIKPRVLVALGAVALKGLLGRAMPITKIRGHWMEYRGIPLMPTFHPAYLLRTNTPGDKRRVWEDMLQVMEKLQLPITPRQRSYFLSR